MMGRAFSNILFLLVVSACAHAQLSRPPVAEVIEPFPRYPDMLLSAKIQGVVELRLPVSADGVPEFRAVKTVESTNDLFLASVRRALASWRFAPARRNGTAVADTAVVRFTFAIDSSSRCPPPVIRRRSDDTTSAVPTVPEPIVTFERSTGQGQILACQLIVVRETLYE